MKIAVIGSGYVGLVTGACFAETGNKVICADKNARKIQKLRDGKIPIFEPGLEELIGHVASKGNLSFTTSTAEAVENSEIIFLAVNTPTLASGEADLQYIRSAAEDIAVAMDGYRLIVNKSTVPVGTYELVKTWVSAKTKHPFHVASNPEFLKEGTALDDFLKPDRVIIGTESADAYKKLAELYAPFVRQGNPILWMDPVSSEVSKYACNAFLAARISFINELAQFCEKVGGDIEKVRKGMTTDARIGKHFLYPGVGYGGSCFPKDVRALITMADQVGVDLRLSRATEATNESQKLHLTKRIGAHFKSLTGKTIAVWGLAFKPNTDDVREAPAFSIIDYLLAGGAKVKVFDPAAMDTARTVLEDRVTYCQDSYQAADGADALVVVTEWNEFRHPDFELLKDKLKYPVVFDGRNLFHPPQMEELGFTYYSIGRPSKTVDQVAPQ